MTLITNLTQLQERIIQTAEKYQRNPDSIQLLAVSKTWPAEHISTLYQNGQNAFAENYLQEALIKIQQLKMLDIEWHFIGPIQSNKTKDIAEHFHWVHSIDRLKVAKRLSNQRPENLPPLNVCIQVNIDREHTKSGVLPEALLQLAEQVSSLPRLVLRGLMVIPRNSGNPSEQRVAFMHSAELYKRLQKFDATVDTLSMGMSQDMELAIEQGTTLVRIGSALFGQRITKPEHNQLN